MAEQAGSEAVRRSFGEERDRLVAIAAAFVDDAEAVVAEAEARYEEMIPSMAYVDAPTHPMASALFDCTALLALYLVLAPRGVDVHAFGSEMLRSAEAFLADSAPEDREMSPEDVAAFIEAAAASQASGAPGEFVYRLLPGDDDTDWGMNVESCAICYQFSRHGAMDLVPYMCATDDVVSDANGQGLRRTGTIALGAGCCDFRYKQGGEPLPLASQYSERIQLSARPTT